MSSSSRDIASRAPMTITFRFEGYPGPASSTGQGRGYMQRKRAAQARWTDTFQGCNMTLNGIDKATPHQRVKLYLIAVERYIDFLHHRHDRLDNLKIRPITNCWDLTMQAQKGVVATLHDEIERTRQKLIEAKEENRKLREKLGML